MHELLQSFIEGLKNTTLLEYVAVFTGILSVWLSRNENILVYPIGLINTVIYIYISVKAHLFGEASVNFYYTVMSIYGWILWAKKDEQKKVVVQITKSDNRGLLQQFLFFSSFYIIIFSVLTYIKTSFAPGAIPWADAFAAATAFTGMWLTARKKIECWHWYIASNIASVPLYFVKHYVFTSLYYVVLLLMAFSGLVEWQRRIKRLKTENHQIAR